MGIQANRVFACIVNVCYVFARIVYVFYICFYIFICCPVDFKGPPPYASLRTEIRHPPTHPRFSTITERSRVQETMHEHTCIKIHEQ